MRSKVLVMLIITVCLFGTFTFMAERALPGTTLYGFKINTLEPAKAKSNTTALSQTQYQITLMEKRLSELKRLSSQSTVSEQGLQDFETQIKSRQTELLRIVHTEKDGLTDQDSLIVLERFASIAGAMELISDYSPALQNFTESAKSIRSESESAFYEKVDRFVEKEYIYNIATKDITNSNIGITTKTCK